MKAAIFLDRDGTINVDSGYVTDPSRIVLIQGAASAIAALRKKGFEIVIVTNQSAVARGMATVSDVEATNQELLKKLLSEDSHAVVDHVFYSVAKPGDLDDTRKPGIGMIKDYQYSKSDSWVVGDKLSDIEFGINAGLPKQNCILVCTGEGNKHREKVDSPVVSDLLAAAKLILSK